MSGTPEPGVVLAKARTHTAGSVLGTNAACFFVQQLRVGGMGPGFARTTADCYATAPTITSIAPLTMASSSLRGTRARERMAMVWMVAEASCASTTGSALSGNS